MEEEPWELEENFNFDLNYSWRGNWAPWEREGSNE
jgi:hypothetical protein